MTETCKILAQSCMILLVRFCWVLLLGTDSVEFYHSLGNFNEMYLGCLFFEVSINFIVQVLVNSNPNGFRLSFAVSKFCCSRQVDNGNSAYCCYCPLVS